MVSPHTRQYVSPLFLVSFSSFWSWLSVDGSILYVELTVLSFTINSIRIIGSSGSMSPSIVRWFSLVLNRDSIRLSCLLSVICFLIGYTLYFEPDKSSVFRWVFGLVGGLGVYGH